MPITAAAHYGHVNITKMLIAAHAYLDVIDHSGYGYDTCSAIFYASWRGHTEVVKLLLEAGANPNIPEHRGGTPLLFAVHLNHMEIARLLIQYKADVNYTMPRNNSWGWTHRSPILIAAERGNLCTVKLLKEAGARECQKALEIVQLHNIQKERDYIQADCFRQVERYLTEQINNDNNNNNNSANRGIVNTTNKNPVKIVDATDCSICLTQFADGMMLNTTVTQCGHKFHAKCLSRHIAIHALTTTCPLCRQNLL